MFYGGSVRIALVILRVASSKGCRDSRPNDCSHHQHSTNSTEVGAAENWQLLWVGELHYSQSTDCSYQQHSTSSYLQLGAAAQKRRFPTLKHLKEMLCLWKQNCLIVPNQPYSSTYSDTKSGGRWAGPRVSQKKIGAAQFHPHFWLEQTPQPKLHN